MPPKKKKGSSKKRKGKASGVKGSRSQSAAVPEEVTLDASAKNHYRSQVNNLERRILRFQRKCDEMEVMNKYISDKFQQLGVDQMDIVAYLKKELDQRLDEIADLNDRIVALQQAKDSEKEGYEAQLQLLRTEFQETKDQLTSENLILSGKLASLEEFKVQREDLMAKFARIEEALGEKDKQHREAIYQLERKHVIDKDALKKEMLVRVNEVAAEFRKLSNKQMAETRKRTIRENAVINAQLKKTSEKTTQVVRENDELRAQDKVLKVQADLLEDHEHDVMRKNTANQKLLKMLIEKCQLQEKKLVEFEQREEQYGLAKASESGARNRLELLLSQKQDLEDKKHEMTALELELTESNSKLEQRLLALQSSRSDRQSMLDNALSAVNHILEMNTVTADYSQAELRDKHDRLLEKLLIVLNNGQSTGVGLRLQDLAPRRKTMVEDKGSSGFFRGTPNSSAITHSRLGQFNFFPSADSKVPMQLEKVPLLSSTTKYKLNKLDQLLA